MQFDNDSNMSDNKEVMQDEQQKITKKKLLNSDTEDEIDNYDDIKEYEQNGEMDNEEIDQNEDAASSDNNDVDLFPIEKANKKLKKKQEEEQ